MNSQATQPGQTDSTLTFGRVCHPACFACRDVAAGGLGLRFTLCDDGSVEAIFSCAQDYQGYPGRLHGGIIATLLDAAMTHCLFAQHIQAVTAKLEVRFQAPVRTEFNATLRAWVASGRSPIFRLHAVILQQGQKVAEGEATFLAQ